MALDQFVQAAIARVEKLVPGVVERKQQHRTVLFVVEAENNKLHVHHVMEAKVILKSYHPLLVKQLQR